MAGRDTVAVGAIALVVDGGAPGTSALVSSLRMHGFRVRTVDGAAETLSTVGMRTMDLIIMTVAAPSVDRDLALCRQVRETCDLPIMIAADLDTQNIVMASLEQGADDCVSRPFAVREVVLRAKALIRHSAQVPAPPAHLAVGNLRLDLLQHVASVDGCRVELSATEFKLLRQLAQNRGTPQNWRSLLHAVWGIHDPIGGRDLVKSAIYRLRTRLAFVGGGTEHIVTLRGAGYLMPDVPPEGGRTVAAGPGPRHPSLRLVN